MNKYLKKIGTTLLQQKQRCYKACFGMVLLIVSASSFAQLAAGQDKFLGNIIQNGGSVPANWNTYWNQVTPENGGKWDALEPNAPVNGVHTYNWTNFDAALNHAKNNGIPFRHHTFLWGNQAPSWLVQYNPGSNANNWSNNLQNGITGAQAVEHLKSLMSAVCERGGIYYGSGNMIGTYIDMIDVVNEVLPSHQQGTNNNNGQYTPYTWPVLFKDALGGDGVSGWDWVAEAFMLARERCPYSKLTINDFGVMNSDSDTAVYIDIVQSIQSLEQSYRNSGRLLQGQRLIDAVGLQTHWFSLEGGITGNDISNRLTQISNATGLPIYITELDIRGDENGNQDLQNQAYQALFPAMYNHCNVDGVTLWGYQEGTTWFAGTGLINSNGTNKPSMNWLESFFASYTPPSCPNKELGAGVDTGGRADQENGNPTLHWNAPTPVSVERCPSPQTTTNVKWMLDFADAAHTDIEGPMTYNNISGKYEGTIPALNPGHGDATITFHRECNGSDSTEVVNVFIDPSGQVKTVEGEPLIGAKVTLLRSDTGINGTYYAPTSDSGVMSPRNTTNPDKTRGYGAFGWDVEGGYYYKVRAEHPQCVSPDNPSQKYIETDPMFIPPEVTGLDLRLKCPSEGATVQISKTNDWGTGYCANVTVTNTNATALDWLVNFSTNDTIYDFWNVIWSQSGSSVVAQGVAWNNVLAAGQSTYDVGFCANRNASPSTSYPITVRARGTSGAEIIQLKVGGAVVGSWTLSTSFQNYTVTTDLAGGITVHYTNDNGVAYRDVVLDYVSINNVIHQTEAQSQNTATFGNGTCGGGSYSEWMHCSGWIGFNAFK